MAAPPDIAALELALDAVDRDTRALVEGLSERLGTWRQQPGSWSVAECLDHLSTGNRVYLAAMTPAAERARVNGRVRRRPATPGLVGGFFVRMLEPPVTSRNRMAAPRSIRPQPSPALSGTAAAFLASQGDVRAFLRTYSEIDLAGVRFVNPFIPVIRFSLATGLHVLAAHARRHLWQAWNTRRAAEAAV